MYDRNCSRCKIKFTTKNKTQNLCNPCNCKAAAEWTKNNKERHYAGIRLRKYKINLNQYKEMLDSQNNKCKICFVKLEFKGRSTHIDHDHKTNKVRGILCNNCNLALGHAKDDIDILQSMISYLCTDVDALGLRQF
jgi:hypothetical protein